MYHVEFWTLLFSSKEHLKRQLTEIVLLQHLHWSAINPRGSQSQMLLVVIQWSNAWLSHGRSRSILILEAFILANEITHPIVTILTLTGSLEQSFVKMAFKMKDIQQTAMRDILGGLNFVYIFFYQRKTCPCLLEGDSDN